MKGTFKLEGAFTLILDDGDTVTLPVDVVAELSDVLNAKDFVETAQLLIQASMRKDLIHAGFPTARLLATPDMKAHISVAEAMRAKDIAIARLEERELGYKRTIQNLKRQLLLSGSPIGGNGELPR